jgi:hypothetical protein
MQVRMYGTHANTYVRYERYVVRMYSKSERKGRNGCTVGTSHYPFSLFFFYTSTYCNLKIKKTKENKTKYLNFGL